MAEINRSKIQYISKKNQNDEIIPGTLWRNGSMYQYWIIIVDNDMRIKA